MTNSFISHFSFYSALLLDAISSWSFHRFFFFKLLFVVTFQCEFFCITFLEFWIYWCINPQWELVRSIGILILILLLFFCLSMFIAICWSTCYKWVYALLTVYIIQQIDACNGFYCDGFKPNSYKKPALWTEDWNGWYVIASNISAKLV